MVATAWNHTMFVQVWPPTWLAETPNTTYSYDNSYFTIHGIWPQYANGSWPQYCQSRPFNLTSLSPIEDQLRTYWTNFYYPVSFWQHEYYKHISCMEDGDRLFPNEYVSFGMGLYMRQAYNIYQWLANENIYPTLVALTVRKDIQRAIHKHYGKKPVVTCTPSGYLEEVRLCMDKNLKPIDCNAEELSARCPDKALWYTKWLG
jgi:ribonuclease T2